MESHDRGAGSIEYIAVVLLIAAIAAAVSTSDVGATVVRGCAAAICRVTGDGACPLNGPDGDRRQTGTLAAPSPTRPTKPPIPKPVCRRNPNASWVDRLNAHNDYQNRRPLTDSLNNGATSVEADVWWEDGELKLKHDQDTAKVGTLRDKYVDPLIERARRQGAIYPGRTEPFQIFIEVKSKPKSAAYDEILKEIADLPPGVQVVLATDATTGDEAELRKVVDAPPNVTFSTDFDDCRIPPRLDPGSPHYDHAYAQRVSVLNGSFKECVSPNANLNADEKAAFTRLVQEVHDAGLKVRIWGGPDGEFRSDWLASGKPFGGDNPFMGDNDSNGDFTYCPPGLDDCARANHIGWMDLQLQAGADYLPTNHLTTGAEHLKYCGDVPRPPVYTTPPPPTGKPAPPTHLPSPSAGPAPRR
ncbi:hypothetical protein GCM10023085_09230 [Actinomadura viridis]|uniref:Glycerophosphoryl diester phosphodiesterase n=1 Tax=Actinomadura viridis TaxID=58110 RepID=A0A931DR91_9ACTN|nr:hypothetical protein [Actinomadura viridis]MBG6091935.1 glycerophosphoryl diester phosphodiesterase [Actinomadura viridis]